MECFHCCTFSALMNEHCCAVTVIFLHKEFSLAAFSSLFNWMLWHGRIGWISNSAVLLFYWKSPRQSETVSLTTWDTDDRISEQYLEWHWVHTHDKVSLAFYFFELCYSIFIHVFLQFVLYACMLMRCQTSNREVSWKRIYCYEFYWKMTIQKLRLKQRHNPSTSSNTRSWRNVLLFFKHCPIFVYYKCCLLYYSDTLYPAYDPCRLLIWCELHIWSKIRCIISYSVHASFHIFRLSFNIVKFQ